MSLRAVVTGRHLHGGRTLRLAQARRLVRTVHGHRLRLRDVFVVRFPDGYEYEPGCDCQGTDARREKPSEIPIPSNFHFRHRVTA